MAFRLASTSASTSASPAVPASSSRRSASSSCGSSESGDDPEDFNDWEDPSAPSVPARALFGSPSKEFKSVEEAAAFDISENGIDFAKEVARLGECLVVWKEPTRELDEVSS